MATPTKSQIKFPTTVIDFRNIPDNIESLLDERIIYLTDYVKENKIRKIVLRKSSLIKKRRVALIEKALDDFRYCKDLLEYHKKYPHDIVVKNRFKDLAKSIILKINLAHNHSSELSGNLKKIFTQIESL
jgi:hypothetical protein